MLLEFGFDPNIRLESGLTPAHLLAKRPPCLAGNASRFQHLKLLYEAGANFELKCTVAKHNKFGDVTPVEYAVLEKNFHIAAFLAEVAGVSLDGVKRLVDVKLMDEYIQAMCVCKRAIYRLKPCSKCKGTAHARVVNILPKPLQLVNAIQAAERSRLDAEAASDGVTSDASHHRLATSRLPRNQVAPRSDCVRRAVRKLLRRNVDKSHQSTAADVYLLRFPNHDALPFVESHQLAEEFDLENLRCKCGLLSYNLSDECTEKRCEYACVDSKL